MSAADRVENDVHAVASEAVSFLYEVLILVVDWNSAQIGDYSRPP